MRSDRCWRSVVGFWCAMTLLVTGCTVFDAQRPPGALARVEGASGSVSVSSSDTSAPSLEWASPVAKVWDLKPSGRLTQPVTVTIPLTQEVPADAQVWLATRSDTSEQWEYLPGTLSADRQTVSAQVEHFSLFTAHLISVPAIVEWIKKDWLSGISQGVLHKVASPKCERTTEARANGYEPAAKGSATLWCLGMEGDTRVLKVVNAKRYPLLLRYGKGLQVLRQADIHQLIPGLSRLASGSASIVLPGDEIVYKVSVRAGEFVALETEFDGLGQSLVALQTGLTTGAAFLSRFGTNPSAAWMQTDRWIISADAASTLFGSADCSAALMHGGAAEVWQSCIIGVALPAMSKSQAIPLISAFLLTGTLISFLSSEGAALIDVLGSKDQQRIAIARHIVPHSDAATEKPNIGSMPSGFAFDAGILSSQDMRLLSLCGKQTDFPGLTERVASRFGYWVSETYESGSQYAAIVMTSKAAAIDLMAQIRERADRCFKTPTATKSGGLKFAPLKVKGDWEQSVAVAHEEVPLNGKEPLESYGTVLIIARRGRSVAAVSYWIYFAQPVTRQDSAMTGDLPKEVSALLDQLPT